MRDRDVGSGIASTPIVSPSMIAMLNHRGPDDRGVHVEPAAGLGHARLSIIDLAGGRAADVER